MRTSQWKRAILPNALALAALLSACAPALVERRGNNLIPKQPAPGKPEVYLRASADAAQLAVRLGVALAQSGAVVHLAAGPAPLDHAYLVSLGQPANEEPQGYAGWVAIGPTAVALASNSFVPLLLVRPPGPAAIEPTARPLWELRFNGLAGGFALSPDEQHTLFEAVALWIRNRAAEE